MNDLSSSDSRPPPGKQSWTDLKVRLASGAVVGCLGVGLLLSKGIVLLLGVSALVALMMWELAAMTASREKDGRRHALLAGGAGGLAMLVSLAFPGLWTASLVLLPIFVAWPGTAPAQRLPFILFSLGIFGAGHGFGYVIEETRYAAFYIAGAVVASDMAGYFAGRFLGGPKLWPAISPKKTWSGTVAGWIAGVFFPSVYAWYRFGEGDDLAILAVFLLIIVLAGQFGDLAESWLKRRVGVKDSSTLIPGHGGVMDRLDALSAAFLAAFLLYMTIGS